MTGYGWGAAKKFRVIGFDLGRPRGRSVSALTEDDRRFFLTRFGHAREFLLGSKFCDLIWPTNGDRQFDDCRLRIGASSKRVASQFGG